jgi:hypothetical protein
MNDELEMVENEVVVACLMYYPCIRLRRLEEVTKGFSSDNRSPGRDSNWDLPNSKQSKSGTISLM